MTRPRFFRRVFPKGGHGEDGFTLAELIVAIAIETVIFSALAAAFIVVMNGGSSVNENLKRSGDARLAAAYFASDARNSSGPSISLVDTTSCADPTPPVVGTQTPVARFNWNSPNSDGTTTANISNYVLVAGNLLRRHCEAGTLTNDSVLAANVESVTVACSANADCSGTPTSITVTITETLDAQSTTPYVYSLTAAFRTLNGGGSSLTPPPPQSLVIFGSGGCGMDISGGSIMKVYGQASVNAVDSGSCAAINLSRGGTFSAGSTSILQGGSCVASGGSVCPTTTSYPTPLGDPYAGLAVPPTQPNQTNACGGTSGSFTTAAGTYTTPFVVAGSVHCTLASGIYVFKAGFSITAGAVVTSAPGGVLLYLTGGAFNIDGSGNIALAAMTTGAYSGLVVWQAAADSTTFNLAAGGIVAFTGAVYVPNAEVLISGNAQATRITSLVTQNVVMQGSPGIYIGASAVPLSISAPASLPAWTVNRPYPSTTMTPAGGDGRYTWSATGLPTGIALNTSTGVISGTPTVAGSAAVTVTLNDALGDDANVNPYTLVINAVPTISTASLPNGEKTLAYSTTLAGSGGTGSYTWGVTNLPAGVTYSTTTGVISGTPTLVVSQNVGITLTDAAGATAVAASLPIVVVAQPTIVSVTLANGTGTAGTIDAGDTVTVVFSAQMSVASLCSTWSGDTTNQGLVANNDVIVSIANAATDALSLTSTTCTFNFGSINLGSAAYVSVAATFKGGGPSASKISWTAATETMVITLGAMATGTVGPVATSTPIYTASTAIKDSPGALLVNSPFTLPAGKKF